MIGKIFMRSFRPIAAGRDFLNIAQKAPKCSSKSAITNILCSHVEMKRFFSRSALCLFPRTEHFRYIGAAGNTPKKMAILSKRAKKKEKSKKAGRELKGLLDEDRMAEERLKEDIEETVENVRKRLHLKENDIPRLNLSIDYLLSQKIPFSIINKICNVAPKTIALDLATLKKRIVAFKINSLYEDSMIKIFKKNPKILLLRLEETLTLKVETIRRLPLGLTLQEIHSLLVRCPDIIEYLNNDKMLEKITLLEEKIGFNKKQVRRILLKNPAVLTMKISSTKEKIDFCLKHFNVDLDKIAKYPRLFHAPIGRLRERFEYLEQEGLAGDEIRVKGWAFKAIAANSDIYFAEKIAQKPLKRFRDFQQKRRQQLGSVSESLNEEVENQIMRH